MIDDSIDALNYHLLVSHGRTRRYEYAGSTRSQKNNPKLGKYVYQGVADKREKIKNDKMPDSDFVRFLTSSLMGCETMYVCCSWQNAHLFKQAMINLARNPKAMIVWEIDKLVLMS